MKLFLAGLALLAVARGSLACYCPNMSTDDRLCSADFIVKVAMGNYVSDGTDEHYWAAVNFVYKGDVKHGQTQLFIDDAQMCIADDLGPGQYVVAGSFGDEGELRLSSCTFVATKWADLKAEYSAQNDLQLKSTFEQLTSCQLQNV